MKSSNVKNINPVPFKEPKSSKMKLRDARKFFSSFNLSNLVLIPKIFGFGIYISYILNIILLYQDIFGWFSFFYHFYNIVSGFFSHYILLILSNRPELPQGSVPICNKIPVNSKLFFLISLIPVSTILDSSFVRS